VAFVERADAPSICAALDRHRAERINCIPAVWRRVLDHGVDGDRVRFADTGTSATPLDLLEAISGAFPRAQVRVFYGSTEAGVVASLPHADMRRKPGSCGVPGTASDVRIATDGELLVRGPLLCDGYYDDAVATADAFVDGWYRTGDLAEADDDGYLTIIGRTRDVLRTGGEAVAPAEIEAVIATHPGVEDVAVVGLPDVQWGEVVCAVVVPPTGKDAPTLDELREYCTGRLAPFKHPRRVYVVDAIPRTAATNQVQRRLLVEQLSDWHPTTVRR
jgi:acyl-CoA synthetase (AMP-forming)/AMP-acid ligase II